MYHLTICQYVRRILVWLVAGLTKTQEMTLVRGIASQCQVQPLPSKEIEVESFQYNFTSLEKSHVQASLQRPQTTFRFGASCNALYTGTFSCNAWHSLPEAASVMLPNGSIPPTSM